MGGWEGRGGSVRVRVGGEDERWEYEGGRVTGGEVRVKRCGDIRRWHVESLRGGICDKWICL